MNPAEYKILVIDDELTGAGMISQHLQACSYRVVGIRTSQSVLKRVMKELPSLILLDLASSQAGLKVCRELKNNPGTRDIALIMAATVDHPSDKLVALELGADDYVSKPVNLHELSLRVERSLERAHDRQL